MANPESSLRAKPVRKARVPKTGQCTTNNKREDAQFYSRSHDAVIRLHRKRESRHRASGCKTERPPVYCLSYTALFLGLLPSSPVSPVVTIRDLPSADTTTRPVTVTFPSFLTVIFIARSPIFLYDRMSEVGSPVTA